MLACALFACGATNARAAAQDTLSFETLAARVRATHPVVRQANAIVEAARADQQVARGAFDPTLSGALERKVYASTPYYEYGTAKLTIPTPFGADVGVGFERALGRYLNPERRVPASGLVSLSLKLPVGQRWITDERRTGLAVARAARDAAEAERDATINKLLVSLAKDYASWYEIVQRDRLITQSVTLAEFRFTATRQRVLAGEAAAIDTIEARLEVRRRRALQDEARQALLSARAMLEAYLWDERSRRERLPGAAQPQASINGGAYSPERVSAWIADSGSWATAVVAHPDLRRVNARLASQLASERLTRQGLLPNASFEIGALDAGSSAFDGLAYAGAQSMKMSATLSQSILLMRERGRANAAAARSEAQFADAARIGRDVEVAFRVALNDLATYDRLLATQREALSDAQALQVGEQRRFAAGESTLFIVNARDRAVLEESIKLAALEAKRMAAKTTLQAALGIVR